jgi:hypothetical protein
MRGGSGISFACVSVSHRRHHHHHRRHHTNRHTTQFESARLVEAECYDTEALAAFLEAKKKK